MTCRAAIAPIQCDAVLCERRGVPSYTACLQALRSGTCQAAIPFTLPNPRELMPPANPRPQPLGLIRLSLMAGVLMFGAVILFLHRQPGWTPGTVPPALYYALVACTIVAVSVAVVLKGRVSREPDPQRRATLLITGWAVGEGAGLFGAVIFFFTDQVQWYALGLLAMLCSFVLLPPDATSPTVGGLDPREG